MKKKEMIDFVVMWVDGSDPIWLKRKQKYTPGMDVDAEANRYRDWGLLKYWFRGVAQFTPWVHRVFFITDHQIPFWLNVNNSKLKIVNHEDYIDQKFLPLFNSSAIECTINRVPELAEKFVLFNDDMFIIKETTPNNFFEKGLPKDIFAESSISATKSDEVFPHILINNLNLVKDGFKKREFLKTYPLKYFNVKYGKYNLKSAAGLLYKNLTGFYDPHLPQPFLKSSFESLQSRYPEKFEVTLNNRFRSKTDITQYGVRYYQLTSNLFAAQSTSVGKYFDLTDDNTEHIVRHIVKKKSNMICINDTDLKTSFLESKMKIIKAFNTILPHKSEFEL